MKAPIGKVALDAMTDQSLAQTRGSRADAHPSLLHLSSEAAAILAEQFPADLETAGRVVMSVVQMLTGLEKQVSSSDAELIANLTDILALAAEQVVREAGGR